MTAVRFSALILELLVFTAAGLPVESQSLGGISGVVVAEGGVDNDRPLEGASIQIVRESAPTERLRTVTDQRGNFLVPIAIPGRYLLQVSKSGYATMNFGAFRSGEPGTPIVLPRSPEGFAVSMRLPRTGTISGLVQTMSGEAVASATVTARAESQPTGSLQSYSVTSDAHGAYRLFGIPPKYDYVVSASGTGRRTSSTFPSGAAETTSGQRVVVAPGEERDGIHVFLPPESSARIVGLVLNVDRTPVAQLWVRLEAGLELVEQVRTDRNGKFTFEGLRAGDYLLSTGQSSVSGAAHGSYLSSSDSWSEKHVQIPLDGTVTATLELQPTMILSGHVSEDESPGGPVPHAAMLELVRLDRRELPLQSPIINGAFRITGVRSGVYRFELRTETAWWIKSAQVSRRNFPAGSLTIDTGMDISDVDVRLSPRRSNLNGTLYDRNGRPSSDYWVALIPRDPALWQPGSPRLARVRPDTNGQFTFSGLPAGDYYVGAFGDIRPQDWETAPFLEQLARMSVVVALRDATTSTQDLRVGGSTSDRQR